MADSQNADLHEAILTEAVAYSLGNDKSKVVCVCQALGQLYQNSKAGTSAGDSATQVASIMGGEKAFTPDHFAGFSEALNNGNPTFTLDPRPWAHAIGLGVQTMGGFVSLIQPEIGVALSVAGTWAEDGLNYLAQPGVNLQYPFVPPATADQLASLSRSSTVRILDTCGADQAFQSITFSPQVSAKLGIDLSEDTSTAANALPSPVKDAIQPVLDGDPADLAKDPTRSSEAVDHFVTAFNNQIADVKTKTLAPDSIPPDAPDAPAQRAAAEKARQFANQELTGAIDITSAIIGGLLGDKRAAQILHDTATAAQQAYSALSAFNDGTIGPLALAGSYVTIGLTLANLLSGPQPSLFSQLSDLITSQLKALRDDIDQQFLQVESQLSRLGDAEVAILQQLTQLLSTIADNHLDDIQLLSKLNDKISQAEATDSASKRQQYLVTFNGAIEQARTAINRGRTQGFDYDGQLDDATKVFVTHALDAASTIDFTGDYVTPPGPALFRDQISERRNAELLFGLLPAVATQLGFSTGIDGTANPLSNPIEWGRGAEAYLETKALALDYKDTLEDRLSRIWNEGLRLQSVILSITQPEVIRSAATAYENAALIGNRDRKDNQGPNTIEGVLNSAFAKFAQSLTPSWREGSNVLVSLVGFTDPTGTPSFHPQPGHFPLTGDQALKMYLLDRLTYRPMPNVYFFDMTTDVIEIVDDPITAALKLGIISKKTIKSGTNQNDTLAYDCTYELYQVQVNVGPDKDTIWGSDVAVYARTALDQKYSADGPEMKGGGSVTLLVKSNFFDPVNDNSNVAIPTDFTLPALFSYLMVLIRENADYSIVVKTLSRALAGLDIPYFEGAAAIAKLCVVLGMWRMAKTDLPGLTDVENCPAILSTNEQVLTILENSIATLPVAVPAGAENDAMPWRTYLIDAISKRVQSDAKVIADQAKPAPLEEGVLAITGTMKRLAGYMKVFGIPFDLPPAPPDLKLSLDVQAVLGQLVTAARTDFASIKGKPQSLAPGWFDSTIAFPGSGDSGLSLGPFPGEPPSLAGISFPMFSATAFTTKDATAAGNRYHLIIKALAGVIDSGWSVAEKDTAAPDSTAGLIAEYRATETSSGVEVEIEWLKDASTDSQFVSIQITGPEVKSTPTN
jgi:hypothetical protein